MGWPHEGERMIVADVSETMVAVILFAVLVVVVYFGFLSKRKR